jgi:hypothetical protein
VEGAEGASKVDKLDVPGGVDEDVSEVGIGVVDEPGEDAGPVHLVVPGGLVGRGDSLEVAVLFHHEDAVDPPGEGAGLAFMGALDGRRGQVEG